MRQLKKIKIETVDMLYMLTLVAFFITVLNSNATTFYSRNSANWNVNSTWSTVGYGGAAATNYPQANDTAKIGNTYTVTVNTNSACAQLDIGQGASGIVQYSGAGIYTLTVSGNITVNAGASLIYNINSSKTHILQVGGNFTNNGTVDLYFDANDIVNITFNTSTISVVSGSGTWSLSNVTINKSTSAAIVEVQVNAFETAINTLTASTGTYIHNNSGSYSVNSSAVTDFAINQNMVFKIPQGTMWFSPNSNRTNLYGALYVTGGNVYIGTTAGNNGLRYDQIGTNAPYLEVASGTLTVYGGISYATGAATNPFIFRMTGGTILLNNGTSGTIVEPFLINDVAGSIFYMSAGTIILQAPNYTGSVCIDWGICGNNGSVTTLGGTVQFGNASTGNNKTFSFVPYPNAVQPNLEVAGPAGNTITLAPFNSTSANYKLLSLKINSGKIFDNRSYGGTANDSKRMTLTATYDGVYGFFNNGTLTARTGNVVMQSTEVQAIGGSTVSTFYNLTIDNVAGVSLQTSENVSSLLTMTSGILTTTASQIITCTSTGNATMGSTSSYVNGPMVQTVATSSLTTRNFPIGKGAAYRPAVLTATHSNNTSVTYTGEMFNISATSLGYALPSTINKVSYTRYWDFVRQNVANLSAATMTLYYDVDDSVPDRTRVAVVHDNGSGWWVDYGGTGTANITGNITSGAISSFKTKFALGFPPSPLPVELLGFTAKKSGHEVLCNWETASEVNNNYFAVERSPDGIVYSPIGIIKAAGNSTARRSYHFEDINPPDGDSYYRLKQTDFDGIAHHFDAVHIFFGTGSNDYVFYPNPSTGIVHVRKTNEQMSGVNAIVQDMNGNQVPASISYTPDNNELIIDISRQCSTASSSFVIMLVGSGEITREKVLVEKQ